MSIGNGSCKNASKPKTFFPFSRLTIFEWLILKLAALSQELEGLYWSFVCKDNYDYYFFIYDMLYQKQRSKVTLALEKDQIAGLMLIYGENIVQMRGKPEAANLLLDSLGIGYFELQAPVEWEKTVLAKFPNCWLKAHMTLMTVKKGEENLNVTVEPEKLHVEDAYAVAMLMRESYPEVWSAVTGENVKEMFGSTGSVWMGIKLGGKLVAFGSANLAGNVAHVMWLATSEQERNQSYGTSIVSALMKECLKKADKALIYVLDDNETAKSVYLKVGFKPYKTYLYLKTQLPPLTREKQQ
jgi:predicted GNAT family acetyltransferase